ncbi:unnamed protein product, partial [Mycena citricolor]
IAKLGPAVDLLAEYGVLSATPPPMLFHVMSGAQLYLLSLAINKRHIPSIPPSHKVPFALVFDSGPGKLCPCRPPQSGHGIRSCWSTATGVSGSGRAGRYPSASSCSHLLREDAPGYDRAGSCESEPVSMDGQGNSAAVYLLRRRPRDPCVARPGASSCSKRERPERDDGGVQRHCACPARICRP